MVDFSCLFLSFCWPTDKVFFKPRPEGSWTGAEGLLKKEKFCKASQFFSFEAFYKKLWNILGLKMSEISHLGGA